ncbi:MAG: polymer-forming cytoskeletal protein [Sneathiellaceae bacterium]
MRPSSHDSGSHGGGHGGMHGGSRTGTDPKTLIVGKEISLNGEISSCDRLIVEGKVEASLAGCQFIEIADGGIFKGAAEIQDAEIRGLFEGKLTVQGRLLICATGRVVGEVRYGQIEIECGGEVSGTIDKAPAAPPARVERPAPVAAPAPKLQPEVHEEEKPEPVGVAAGAE